MQVMTSDMKTSSTVLDVSKIDGFYKKTEEVARRARRMLVGIFVISGERML